VLSAAARATVRLQDEHVERSTRAA